MENDKWGSVMWLCECDCPAHTRRVIVGQTLRDGKTRSCGCERRSHGEQEIAKILSENNIFFEQEKNLFTYSSGHKANFDFYINNTYAIEYDGI